MRLSYYCENQTVDLDAHFTADRLDGAWSVTLPDSTTRTVNVRLAGVVASADGTVSFDLREADAIVARRCTRPVVLTERGIEYSYLGRTYVFTERGNRSGSKGIGYTGSGSLVAPMVGVLSELCVAEGDTVAQYQPVAIVEAMKVMATIEAPFAGVVKRVHASKGAQLTHGQLIIDIVPSKT